MTVSEFIHRCEIPARRRLPTAESAALTRLARQYGRSNVVRNWKIYLFGGGLDAVEFERLFPVANNFRSTNTFANVQAQFSARAGGPVYRQQELELEKK